MILGNIYQLSLVPFLPSKLVSILTDVTKKLVHLKAADRYDIDGDNVFFMLSDNITRAKNEALFEFHQRYIDIHIILEGKEHFAVSTIKTNLTPTENKLAQNDIAFVDAVQNEVEFTLNKDDFVIIYPNELHKPLCHVNDKEANVRKIVVKIDANWLNLNS